MEGEERFVRVCPAHGLALLDQPSAQDILLWCPDGHQIGASGSWWGWDRENDRRYVTVAAGRVIEWEGWYLDLTGQLAGRDGLDSTGRTTRGHGRIETEVEYRIRRNAAHKRYVERIGPDARRAQVRASSRNRHHEDGGAAA